MSIRLVITRDNGAFLTLIPRSIYTFVVASSASIYIYTQRIYWNKVDTTCWRLLKVQVNRLPHRAILSESRARRRRYTGYIYVYTIKWILANSNCRFIGIRFFGASLSRKKNSLYFFFLWKTIPFIYSLSLNLFGKNYTPQSNENLFTHTLALGHEAHFCPSVFFNCALVRSRVAFSSVCVCVPPPKYTPIVLLLSYIEVLFCVVV